jgi:hypothetical protein
MRLIAIPVTLMWLVSACSPGLPVAFGRPSPSEFDQPLPEPTVQPAKDAPSGTSALAGLQSSGIQSARFRIIGTQMAPRPQGQIGARVYHLDGELTTEPSALELQPWDDSMAGIQYNIDGRGDLVSIGTTIYVRANTLSAWQAVTASDPYWSLFANINPGSWSKSSRPSTLGEASIDRSPVWVVKARNAFGQEFKVWIRQRDYYPLRYTTTWVNAKGMTYYINALYRDFNSVVVINPPDMSNRGIVATGTPVKLPAGSVTVTETTFDCFGTLVRHPAPHHKFVLITLVYEATGPGSILIEPSDWRLYGDGVDGAAPTDTGAPDLLRTQVLMPGKKATGKIAFEVPEDAYQLLTVGKLVGAIAVVTTGFPMLPVGQSPCV